MAIGNAVQRGAFVNVYDENGRVIQTIPAGFEPDDGLKGYTANTVNIKRGGFIYTYDERGRVLNTVSAR